MFKVYDDAYDRASIQSNILNSGSQNWGVSSIIWTKSNIENEIYLLTGDRNGTVLNPFGETLLAKIPHLEQKLAELETKFHDMQTDRRLNGFPEYVGYPPDMMNKKLDLEAQFDICVSEVEFLKDRLKKGQQVEDEIRQRNVLKYGLRQAVSHKDGRIDEIDFQKVSYIDDVPIIEDKCSPYNGMSVADYRQLSNSWLADRRSADSEKLKKAQVLAKESNQPIPKSLPIKSIKEVDLNSLPAWPEGVLNHFKKEKV